MTHMGLRLSGIVLIVGAILLGLAIVIAAFSPVGNQPLPSQVNLLFLVSALLLLVALPALYAKQARAAGWLGFMGYVLLQVGIVLLALLGAPPLLFPSLTLIPSENLIYFLLGIALTLGLLLTGIATVRAGVLPRWLGILLLAATVGFFFDFFVAEYLPRLLGQMGTAFFGLLLGLALVGLGCALWMSKPTPIA